MDTESPPGPLNLFGALLQWTDPQLVEAVRAEERRHLTVDVHHFYDGDHRLQLSADADLRQPSGRWAGPPSTQRLRAAWDALERDMRLRLEEEEFHLTGVPSLPERSTTRQPIPSVWAADMRFFYGANAVRVGEARYVAVQATRGPEPPPAIATAPRPGAALKVPAAITISNAREFSDDEIVALLEDHARRVIEHEGARLMDVLKTKVSVMPIIRRKMESRAAAGVMEKKISAEAEVLAEWIATKVPSHQTPTAGSI